ncbi:MAG: hypothetical protein JXB35_16040 [Anaerolineae bacterium]|nr:hypothetical protein [Anaerolineae bacterium]
MENRKCTFTVGAHRPVYLWAGPGTIRMNRLKFMETPVDEAVHYEAHTLVGAVRIAQEARFNWAYLMYDWGFPPEIEQEDWDAFRQTAPVFQTAGVRVFGYIQTSNYVASGSYEDQDWYAVDPQGRPFHYYTGRYMSCWQHPEWQARLRDRVKGVVEAGADGVFFDNPWYGIQPLSLAESWIGGAGCYCARCTALFTGDTGRTIPVHLDPEHDETSQIYLRWRAARATALLSEMADYARMLNPDILISANDFDAVMRPSFVAYGIDLAALAKVQDVIMIEDFGLPQWKNSVSGRPARLTNNALTIRTARALIGNTPLTVDPYDRGIGFDTVYAPRRFQQGIAEAAACGAAMVVKGTEFVEPDGTFTLLTAEKFGPEREAIGTLHRWLGEHAGLFEARRNAARTGILYPGDRLWQAWRHVAPLYFGMGQTLLLDARPWRVVAEPVDLEGLDVLLHVTPLPETWEIPQSLQTLDVAALPEWRPPSQTFLTRNRWARRLVGALGQGLFRAYFEKRWMRRLVDRAGLVQKLFMQTPLFDVPEPRQRRVLLEALGPRQLPRVTAQLPVLMELWQQEDVRQIHLVNYADAPQLLEVKFERPVCGRLLTPQAADREFKAQNVELDLDVYAILLYRDI